MIEVIRIAGILCLLIGVPLVAYSQDGSGRSSGGGSSAAKPVTKKTLPKATRAAPKNPPAAKTPTKPKSKKTAPKANTKAVVGRSPLSISVSQPGAEISIVGKGIAGFEPIRMTSEAAEVPFVTELAAGNYTITVSKSGFVDSVREVRAAGKPLDERFDLTVASAFLVITSSVPAVEIEVLGVGKTTGNTMRVSLPLGTYRVAVKKRGYVSKTEDVTLSRHGVENRFNFSLEKATAEKQIASAEAALAREDFATVIQFAREAVEIEPGNSRAGLILGLALYAAGEPGASSYLIETMRRGESFTIPVHYYTKGKDLLQANLTIRPQDISLEVPTKPKENLLLRKLDFKSASQRADGTRPRQVLYRGQAINDGGKRSERELIFYSQFVILQKKIPTCTREASMCEQNSTSLNFLLMDWGQVR